MIRYLALLMMLVSATDALAQAAAIRTQTLLRAAAEVSALSAPYVFVKGVKGVRAASVPLVGFLTIAGAAILRKKIEIERAQGHALTQEQIKALYPEIADELMAAAQSLASFKAVELTDRALQRAGLVGATAEPTLFRAALTQSLGVAGSLGSVALLTQLWESTLRKLSTEERRRLTNVVQFAAGALGSPDAATFFSRVGDEIGLVAKVAGLMGEIAIVDADERDLWLYDTWRNKIANGTTVSTAMGMAAGATLGSFMPVVGTGAGATVGAIVGGAGAMALTPDDTRDRITLKIIQYRRAALESQLGGCMERARVAIRARTGFGERVLRQCEKVRNDLVTILLDDLTTTYGQLQIANSRIFAATQAGREDARTEWIEKLRRAEKRLEKLRFRVKNAYPDKIAAVKDLIESARSDTDRALIGAEVQRMTKAHENLCAHVDRMASDRQAAIQLLAFSMSGFYEETFAAITIDPATANFDY